MTVPGLIFDVKRFSLHDGPGIRTTIFFKGCPLHCPWCHNPESQAPYPELMVWAERCIRCGACIQACPQEALCWEGGVVVPIPGRCTRCGACAQVCYAEARRMVGQERTVAEVMAEVERDRPFYDQSGGGVTLSGGEPLLQPDFLYALLLACRERGVHTALDTCGFAPWETMDRVRPLVDLFLYDLKLLDEEAHHRLTGVSNRLILDNLRALSSLGHRIILRLAVIPGVNDRDDHLRRIGELAADLPHLERLDLLPYHRAGADKYRRLGQPYGLADLRPLPDARMDEIVDILTGFGLQVKIGG